MGKTGSPECSKDAKGLPAAISNRPRFKQQIAIEALRGDTALSKLRLQIGISADGGWLLTAIPKYGGCARCGQQIIQGFACWTAANDQARAALFEFRTESGERASQPPFRGSTWPPSAVLFGLPDKHRNDWTAPVDSGGQGGIVR